jgi:hypothetical protein
MYECVLPYYVHRRFNPLLSRSKCLKFRVMEMQSIISLVDIYTEFHIDEHRISDK